MQKLQNAKYSKYKKVTIIAGVIISYGVVIGLSSENRLSK